MAAIQPLKCSKLRPANKKPKQIYECIFLNWCEGFVPFGEVELYRVLKRCSVRVSRERVGLLSRRVHAPRDLVCASDRLVSARTRAHVRVRFNSHVRTRSIPARGALVLHLLVHNIVGHFWLGKKMCIMTRSKDVAPDLIKDDCEECVRDGMTKRKTLHL